MSKPAPDYNSLLNYFTRSSVIFVLIFQFGACKAPSVDLSSINLADTEATNETKLLYHHLKNIASRGIALGHQDATAYGIGWKSPEGSAELSSDIRTVSGKLPAVHGYDIGHIELGKSQNLDTVPFSLMKKHIEQLHRKGAIITMSWHLDNPVSGGSSWDTTAAVPAILKGGAEREKYELWIKRLSQFFRSLKTRKGEPIPIVFRPFHEMNGSWFWWGGENVTPEDYKALWRETQLLLQENQVHNLLFAYAPNTLGSSEEFDRYYPGDEYVDILGVDIYNHSGNEAFTMAVKKNLQLLRQKASPSGKPFALTETGNNNFGEDPNWWTETLYPGIKDSGISWLLLWRNARPSHYFSTYPGEISEEDFREFANYEEILFLKETHKTYNP